MAEPFPTRSDLFRVGAAEVFARSALRPAGKRLKPEAVFTDGTDANILIAATAAMGDEALRHLSARIMALYLDSATEEDLDRLVADRISPTMPRKGASRALVPVLFSRTDTAETADIDLGTEITTADGTVFVTVQATTFGVGMTGPLSALAQSTLAGRGGNVDTGTISQFVSAPSKPDITVINAEPAAGGQDQESDAEYRSRAKDFYLTVRRATLSAIEFGALTVPGVSRVSVVEETDSNGFPTGKVYVYIADIEGRGNAALVDAVYIALLDYRAAGIVPGVLAGVPQLVDIAYQVQFDSATDTRQAIARIKSATVSSMETLRPGNILRLSSLYSIARSVSGVIVPANALVAPAGDLVPSAPYIVLRTTTARVTVNGI
jgi:uncharacterized phage protein gp47/JayE